MKTGNMVLAAFFAAITAVCSQISIPAGISAVPFSLSIVGVLLSGTLLDFKTAFISQIVYLLMGIAGLPVFAQLRGGFSVLAGPTGGYLFVYPAMAVIIAFLCGRAKKRSFIIMLLTMLPALCACYISGALWLSFTLSISFTQALYTGAVPFIIPDIIKAALSSALSVFLLRALCRRYPGYLQTKHRGK